MKTAGIVAEYNPFHKGHEFHIQETREQTKAECIVAVMSGNFVQRGEPAIFNKWIRAEAAINSGVDLVVELPVVYSCAGAEFFAMGAIKLLDSMGCLDYISFGAETEELGSLQRTAHTLAGESRELKAHIRRFLDEGNSYASARSKAIHAVGMKEESNLISKPNNILAVEYLKQIIRQGSRLEPILVERKSAGYYEENRQEGFAGAGKIRDLMLDGMEIHELSQFIPQSALEVFKEHESVFADKMYTYLVYKLLTESGDRLEGIDGVFEGLENRAKRAAVESIDYESLINGIKSRRYSRTTIQRMLVRILLGIRAEDMRMFIQSPQVYLRVLGFNDRGARLIREIKRKKKNEVSIITNINKERPEDHILRKMLSYDVMASEVYNLIKYSKPGVDSDYRRKPYCHK